MEEEVAAEVEAEEAEEEEVEAEKELPPDLLIREMSENKERCLKNSMEIAPKRKNSSKTCEATFT